MHRQYARDALPLSCGYGDLTAMVEFGQGAAPVNVFHCVQVGGQDIDDLERQRMARKRGHLCSINMIDKLWDGRGN